MLNHYIIGFLIGVGTCIIGAGMVGVVWYIMQLKDELKEARDGEKLEVGTSVPAGSEAPEPEYVSSAQAFLTADQARAKARTDRELEDEATGNVVRGIFVVGIIVCLLGTCFH